MRTLSKGLIVSCQAEEGSPFNGPSFIAAFAQAAEMGKAVGVRIRDIENVDAVRRTVHLPIIGLTKGQFVSGKVLITPVIEDAVALAGAGADVVALDATDRRRPCGLTGREFLRLAKATIRVPVLADISTLEEALDAVENGADMIATTLSGYTEASPPAVDEPDFDLIEAIASRTTTPIIAEGRIWTPGQARKAMECGAFAVCVGTAITRPAGIVERFVRTLAAGA